MKAPQGKPSRDDPPPGAPEPPAPEGSTLEPPSWMGGETLLVWNAVVPVMIRMRVATLADVNAIARYCDAVVLWQRARDFLHANGSTYSIRSKTPVQTVKPDGQVVEEYPVTGVAQFPQVWEYRQLSRLLLAFEAEYGLTASSRTRIDVKASAPLDPAARSKMEFFRRGGPVAGAEAI